MVNWPKNWLDFTTFRAQDLPSRRHAFGPIDGFRRFVTFFVFSPLHSF
jgi:hypothetical protein